MGGQNGFEALKCENGWTDYKDFHILLLILYTYQSLINNRGRLFIFEKFSTLVALIAAWSLIFFKVLTLLVRNWIHKRFEVLGISDKYPNKVGNKQLCNGLDSITRLNIQDLGIVSYLNLGHCLLVTNWDFHIFPPWSVIATWSLIFLGTWCLPGR